ncbi:hypothetical protein [Lactobacillus xylocopicola]|uniref:Uncharacterized protein n=1 Tax=Lactobacillus xylocopicola TaxID=2976676 RepID=A0ABM8BH69_9LACO|nr:hypothetical protein [Lactobacillus xylocopicola]BDR60611.1 hypothetical protein KIM322_08720 [Lactobacillus xylocopicola]
MNEIKSHLYDEDFDFFDVIGSVDDLFSSSYQTKSVISDLWGLLLQMFLGTNDYENKTTALFAMSDIINYARKTRLSLDLDPLKQWRKSHDIETSSLEVIEC